MRHARPTSLFRGSELPRLLFLVAIVAAGWPVCLMFASSDEPAKPTMPPVPAAKLTPIVPDDDIVFQAVQDKTEVQTRETGAYVKLLRQARETSAADLSKQARRDVYFTHLWERPERYRGVPVHLTGVARKIITYEVAPTMTPAERLYEVWFYSDENRSFPYVVVIQDPPQGLAIGHELSLPVTVDGYFLKLMKYRAGDNFRAAPMLVGRMSWTPPAAPAPSTFAELSKIPKRDLAIGLFVLFLLYMAVRVILQIRKARALARPKSSLMTPSSEIPPEQLADWLQNLPEESDETDAGHATPR